MATSIEKVGVHPVALRSGQVVPIIRPEAVDFFIIGSSTKRTRAIQQVIDLLEDVPWHHFFATFSPFSAVSAHFRVEDCVNLQNGQPIKYPEARLPFVANRYLSSPPIARRLRDLSQLLLPVFVSGSVSQRNVSCFGQELSVTMILRRVSGVGDGPRYYKRGALCTALDAENALSRIAAGEFAFIPVANLAETELIVSTGARIASHIQVRGTVPMLWNQLQLQARVPSGDGETPARARNRATAALKPSVRMNTIEASVTCLTAHMASLAMQYGGPVSVLTLLKSHTESLAAITEDSSSSDSSDSDCSTGHLSGRTGSTFCTGSRTGSVADEKGLQARFVEATHIALVSHPLPLGTFFHVDVKRLAHSSRVPAVRELFVSRSRRASIQEDQCLPPVFSDPPATLEPVCAPIATALPLPSTVHAIPSVESLILCPVLAAPSPPAPALDQILDSDEIHYGLLACSTLLPQLGAPTVRCLSPLLFPKIEHLRSHPATMPLGGRDVQLLNTHIAAIAAAVPAAEPLIAAPLGPDATPILSELGPLGLLALLELASVVPMALPELPKILAQIIVGRHTLSNHGFSSWEGVIGAEGELVWVPLSHQHGVLRTNCLDSVDRTSVAQLWVGVCAFIATLEVLIPGAGHFLRDLASRLAPSPAASSFATAVSAVTDLYKDAASTVSAQYCGSSDIVASVPDSSNTTVRRFAAVMSRYVQNTITHQRQQAGLTLISGVWDWVNSQLLARMDSTPSEALDAQVVGESVTLPRIYSPVEDTALHRYFNLRQRLLQRALAILLIPPPTPTLYMRHILKVHRCNGALPSIRAWMPPTLRRDKSSPFIHDLDDLAALDAIPGSTFLRSSSKRGMSISFGSTHFSFSESSEGQPEEEMQFSDPPLPPPPLLDVNYNSYENRLPISVAIVLESAEHACQAANRNIYSCLFGQFADHIVFSHKLVFTCESQGQLSGHMDGRSMFDVLQQAYIGKLSYKDVLSRSQMGAAVRDERQASAVALFDEAYRHLASIENILYTAPKQQRGYQRGPGLPPLPPPLLTNTSQARLPTPEQKPVATPVAMNGDLLESDVPSSEVADHGLDCSCDQPSDAIFTNEVFLVSDSPPVAPPPPLPPPPPIPDVVPVVDAEVQQEPSVDVGDGRKKQRKKRDNPFKRMFGKMSCTRREDMEETVRTPEPPPQVPSPPPAETQNASLIPPTTPAPAPPDLPEVLSENHY